MVTPLAWLTPLRRSTTFAVGPGCAGPAVTDWWSTYQTSMARRSRHDVALRPFTCAQPVTPGRTSSRRACSSEYRGQVRRRAAAAARRGSSDPRTTCQNVGSSSRLVARRIRPRWVMRRLVVLGPGLVRLRRPHGSDLGHRERPTAASATHLPEERRRSVQNAGDQSYDGGERGGDHQQDAPHKQVDQPLHEPRPPTISLASTVSSTNAPAVTTAASTADSQSAAVRATPPTNISCSSTRATPCHSRGRPAGWAGKRLRHGCHEQQPKHGGTSDDRAGATRRTPQHGPQQHDIEEQHDEPVDVGTSGELGQPQHGKHQREAGHLARLGRAEVDPDHGHQSDPGGHPSPGPGVGGRRGQCSQGECADGHPHEPLRTGTAQQTLGHDPSACGADEQPHRCRPGPSGSLGPRGIRQHPSDGSRV